MYSPLQAITPSYLYTQYADDDNLQAFVAAYNEIAQQYLNTFNALNLPVYTSPSISGALLDWVGVGIYGYPRPTLPSSAPMVLGPLNTYGPLMAPVLNAGTATTETYAATNDDIYKRLLTWHFYKGDGKQLSIQWLKRRIMRFLLGTDGTAPNIDFTYQISVTFPGSRVVDISMPEYPAAPLLATAIASGAAELPFQYSYSVSVSGSVLPYV